MTVACRLDGPRQSGTVDASGETAVLAALVAALGILERDRLLEHLARWWQQVTGAETAVVAVSDGTAGGYRAGMVDAQGRVVLSTCEGCGPSDATDALLEAARIHRGNGSPRSPRESVIHRDLITQPAGPPIGVLLLCTANPLPNELDRLFTTATAALLSRVMDSDRLLREAKLGSLAEFAAGAGHEINNPLAAISGRAQLLLREEQDPERRRHLTTIGAQALRIRDMIGDTMLFARPPRPQPQVLNLTDVLDTTVDRFAEQLALRGLVVHREYRPQLPLWADEAQLRVVVSELVRNAMEASPPGGTIRIEASCEAMGTSEWVRLTVRDEGPGLSPESAEHLFDPFYSGRQAGRGLGFGLSKCWRIVTNHGGRIDVANSAGPGCCMVVRWPARAASTGQHAISDE